MDDTAKLISELQNKLTELDSKVAKYRRDMASEFTKYAEELLQNVPEDVSTAVLRAIAESSDHRSLVAPGIIESCKEETGTSNHDNHSAEAYILPASIFSESGMSKYIGGGDENPRNSHDREKEFQGLFTPSYLPLLDSTNCHERRASYDSKLTFPELRGKERGMDILQVDAGTSTRSLAASPEPLRPPLPKRRNTDEVSSGSSELSDGTLRRSALRRSSSSSAKSPRRVRFDVEGEEVLPTSSPYSSQLDVKNGRPPTYQTITGDENEDVGSEQIEDVDEPESPPTKRVSSSQRLRALSRSPLADDGTQWTTVSAPPDGSASVAISGGFSTESSTDDLPVVNGLSRARIDEAEAKSASTSASALQNSSSHQQSANSNLENKREMASEDSSDSENDMLSMVVKSKSKQNPSADIPSTSPANQTERSLKSASQKSGSSSMPFSSSPIPNMASLSLESTKPEQPRKSEAKASQLDADEDIFAFDDEHAEHAGLTNQEKYDSGTASPVSPTPAKDSNNATPGYSQSPADGNTKSPGPIYSRSPAVAIAKPAPPSKVAAPSSGAVGSFRGSFFDMPIIDPDLHARAAAMGPINSFVGSVHGRSGLDESDPMSFRNSVGRPTWTYEGSAPKTMQERMLRDEYVEGMAAVKEKAEKEAERQARAARKKH
ncbi:hypothetical protein BJ875DRAFT_481712 [Amylocarpus encephaloides]|uniref:Uncharacterized protein n=1 Tax=Amylocarpus encephaloides TaxID=45428 RepID=A0A9P8C9B9_9HELO|nr:hypothetical protein BJ875DRAFT_481712 [Amylocarpus encephaloides]